ncbi:hypothetical protein ACMHYJ_04915 [Castellaniella hirudinis]|uniref:hypothetical protein n=1 Tax=Castellaniella hirudinis TaxID=1144617 RepID=UPI0039C0ACD7
MGRLAHGGQPGDPASHLFLIRAGLLKVSAISRNGLQRTLWLMGTGSVPREAAWFDNTVSGRLKTALVTLFRPPSAARYSLTASSSPSASPDVLDILPVYR